jgi:hypothetical protein
MATRSTVSLAALLAAALTTTTMVAAASETGRTLGFAVTSFSFSFYRAPGVCPKGFAIAAKDIYLKSVSKAEGARLLRPENLKEFEKKAYHNANGEDLCRAPDTPRPPMITMEGKIGYGMDLDGTKNGEATETTCAHEKLQTPDGKPVDNQMFRLIGCLSNYYGFDDGELGYLESLRNQAFKDGGTTFLIDVTGVDDVKNDSDVTIGFYNGSDPMPIDVAGRMVPYGSLSVIADKKYQSTGKGRIVDGMLMSEPMDVVVKYDFGGTTLDYHVKQGRLHLALGPDGTGINNATKGRLAGYLPLSDIEFGTAKGRQASSEMTGIDCPSYNQAFRRLADGHKDPATGKCTSISTSWDIAAVPAFVIHPEEAQKTAEAAAQQSAEKK